MLEWGKMTKYSSLFKNTNDYSYLQSTTTLKTTFLDDAWQIHENIFVDTINTKHTTHNDDTLFFIQGNISSIYTY